MRIAFIDYVLEPDKPGKTGLSDMVWDMASELVNQGHEAHVIASYHTIDYPDLRVTVHNFPTPPIGYRNIIGQFWILKRAADIAKQLKPDIIHTPEYVSTAIFATLGVKTPLVLTVPGNIFQRIQAGQPDEGFYFTILKWAARVSARRCSKVIAISKEMKHWWEWTGSKPENTPWIPLGVANSRFRFIENARDILGLPSDKIIFLYVGRFSIEKGLLDLIDAIALTEQDNLNKNIKLILIGKGPLLETIMDKIRQKNLANVIEIKSWINQGELPTWYSAADAYVLPSYSEGFSRTIPEAMICGTPIIGSRITGTEDHIKEGINGYLFEPHDIEAMARLFTRISNKDIDIGSLRQSTNDYAQKNLTWSQIITRIIVEVYRPVIYQNSIT